MKKVLDLKSGWVKIEKPELDKLRQQIRAEYEKDGGTKKFNSHLDNYEELREIIKARLEEQCEEQGLEIRINDQVTYDIMPGNTFFRNLLYTNRDAERLRFQEYNLEICYLYAYGQKRIEIIRKSKPKPVAKPAEKPVYSSSRKIIISSTMKDITTADALKRHLTEELGFEVETDTRNTSFSMGSLDALYQGLDDQTMVFSLISRDFLQSEVCLKELIDYLKNNQDLYMRRTLHVLMPDISQGDYNVFDSLGKSELLKYWKLRIQKLEENHKLLLSGQRERAYYQQLRDELEEIKEIIEELHKIIDLIRENQNRIYFDILMQKFTSGAQLDKIIPVRKSSRHLSKKLEITYKRINIPSTNDPENPEFPPVPYYKPHFPASKTFKIDVPGFTNVWLKDESTNPTGTHKDRLAWEVVIKYKSLINGLKYSSQDSLPQMSIISSGSAAIAIQHLFNLYSIPTSLKVLVDRNLADSIKDSIRRIGCQLYECDLSAKPYSTMEIKEMTDNKDGIDITYREVLDPTHDNYYDWLSYEIIREEPDYCLIPFGTGDLFINVLNIVKTEYFNSFIPKHDPRFSADINVLINCNFLGASSNKHDTKLDKLFSYYLPSLDSFRKYIREFSEEYGCSGPMTGIYYIDEQYVDEAMKIADAQGIRYEPSGIAGLALLLQRRNEIPHDAKILIVNTGKTKGVNELIQFENKALMSDK